MKKNIGSQAALYPMPVTIIGAMSGDKLETGKVIRKCLSLKTGESIGEGILCQRDRKN